MKYANKVMAAVFAGTMALASIAPVAAMADGSEQTGTATGTTPVTISKPNAATGDSNIKVTVPTSIPLAVDASNNITGPTTAGFTNSGSTAVAVTNVTATIGAGFNVLNTAEEDSSASNAVYLKIHRTADSTGTNGFNLKEAQTGKTLTGWDLSPNMDQADTITVDSTSKIKNLVSDLSNGKDLATLSWTLTAQES